jgi:hypothetical protein
MPFYYNEKEGILLYNVEKKTIHFYSVTFFWFMLTFISPLAVKILFGFDWLVFYIFKKYNSSNDNNHSFSFIIYLFIYYGISKYPALFCVEILYELMWNSCSSKITNFQVNFMTKITVILLRQFERCLTLLHIFCNSCLKKKRYIRCKK